MGTVECPHIGWRVIALARHGSSDSPSSDTIPYFPSFQIILTILTTIGDSLQYIRLTKSHSMKSFNFSEVFTSQENIFTSTLLIFLHSKLFPSLGEVISQ